MHQCFLFLLFYKISCQSIFSPNQIDSVAIFCLPHNKLNLGSSSVQCTVMRKRRRGPTDEPTEQSVVPGAMPLNPSPSGVSTNMMIFVSSQIGMNTGQTTSPDLQTLKISPTRSATG